MVVVINASIITFFYQAWFTTLQPLECLSKNIPPDRKGCSLLYHTLLDLNKTLTQFWQATLRQFSLTKGIKTDDFNPQSLLSITFPITNTINNTSTCNKRLT